MNILRNLEVPYFSQRNNQTVWNEKYPVDTNEVDSEGNSLAGKLLPKGKTDSKAKNSCNITCLAMILHYFGVTSDTPDEMMRKVFEPTTAGCLRVEASNFDLWENALSQIFVTGNSFYFLHPVYSLRHFERAGLFEFNPYAGMTIRPRFAKGNDSDIEVKSNPGFAPTIPRQTNDYDIERFPIKKTMNGTQLYWAAVNYDFGVTEGYGGNHTGIDLAGYEGTSIYALVNGIVWATTYQGTIENTYKENRPCYGRCMVIKGDNDKLYLLGHLSKFRKKEGERIQVGDVVAEVGNTGYSSAAHLHLEVIECKTGMDDDSRSKVLNMEYNQLHENDGGIIGGVYSLRFGNSKGYYYASKDNQGHGSWGNNRLNPLTGEKK